jgi:DNA-binding response OmpR family regulator
MKINEVSALVVEDDSAQRNLYSKILNKAGVGKVDVANSEKQAIGLMGRTKYHLMILDTEDITGFYGPRILEKAREMGQTPVVFAVSGDPLNREKWEKVNPTDFYPKTELSLKRLTDLVREHFPEQ